MLFVAGWLWLPGSPLVWTLAGALTLAVPVLTGLVLGVVQAVSGSPWRQVFRAFQTGFVRWVLALAFILYETLLTLGGIATTLVRLFVTRKNLLQWTSYAETIRVSSGGVTLNQILAAILSTGALAGLIILIDPTALLAALAALDRVAAFAADRVVDQPPDRPCPRSAFSRRDRAAAHAGAAHVVFFRTVRRP